jgi:hypothetical protein
MRQRLLFMLIALDQFLWCWLTLGRYHPDITLSAQAWQWELDGKRTWPRRLIDWLFWPIEKDHCRMAWIAEREGKV